MVILHFSLSLWDNELRFKSKEPDSSRVTALEEAEELQGYNFLNPHLFYVTYLTHTRSRYKHASRKTFKWNISNLSHFSSVKLAEVLNKK